MLTRRRIEIFKCIVDEFVRTAEPIAVHRLRDTSSIVNICWKKEWMKEWNWLYQKCSQLVI